MLITRIALIAPSALVALIAAASVPAQAGGYYGHGGYGDCADDWRYCDRYLRDDAPYYYNSGYYWGGHGYHSGYGYDRGYRRHYGYRRHDYGHGYDSDYGSGGFVVCDPDGDRCYRSGEPYWNYRTYYRRHGYHWLD